MLVCKICFKSYYFVLALLNYVNSGILGLIVQTTKFQIFMMHKSGKIKGKSFLASPRVYAVMINIDGSSRINIHKHQLELYI